MSDARPAVVAGHGAFAEGLLSAVAAIVGPTHALRAVTNADASPEGIVARLAEAVEASGATVIFTDLPAGSCTMAARKLARARPGLAVVTGASLPVVLAYAAGTPLAAAVASGQAALLVVEGGA